MKEPTRGKSHTSVNIVESVLVKHHSLGLMKEFTLGKSHMNVNSVVSASAHQAV